MTVVQNRPDVPANDVRPGLAELLQMQKDSYRQEGPPPIAVRRDRLDRLKSALTSHTEELARAINADFGTRCPAMSRLGDVGYTVTQIAELRTSVHKWVKAERSHRLLKAAGLSQEVRRTPLGVVGIAGPWNFPIQLTFVPAAGAIAAGNRVMVRPSSMTRRTGEVLAKAMDKYFDPSELAVITADYGPGSAFSKLPFDSFFFTGSPEVGRQVARDCAENLVPVSLELGGKNPVVVDWDANVARAAYRIASAKIMNSGQVCLSPDYLFVPRPLLSDFVAGVLATWRQACPQIQDCPDYTSIINETNFDRIVGHIEDARAKGATVHQWIPPRENLPDRASKKVPPTVLTGLSRGMSIEDDEIFGPVLSVYPYDDIDEVIEFINDRDSPLTLYWYGPDNARKEKLIERTRSGSVNANEFMLNMVTFGLPFGGVGTSGYGYYHGKFSIETFTHARANVSYQGPVAFSPALNPNRINRVEKLAGPLIRLTGG